MVINFYILYKLFFYVNNIYIIVSISFSWYKIFPDIIRNYILIDNNRIYLFFGFSKDSIFIDDIETEVSTYNPITSSAASLDRLVIKSREKGLIVSIEDKEKFINELEKRNPNIKFNIYF